MKKIYFLFALTILFTEARAQDNCAAAVGLCASNLITRTTVGATTVGSDPAIACGDNTVNNSVWFSVLATNTGSCTITVTNIDNTPGLEMQVYTGSCGSLAALGPCASGSALTARTMSMVFATTAGTTYYIMVDGTSGNQEAFDILATTSNDAIVARPDANFNTNPSSGCVPLTVQLQNTTVLHGGSNISYEWRFDAGAYVPASGADTSIVLSTTGTHSVTLRVCNTQCGCKTITQDIIVQDLIPAISYAPIGACVGTDIAFTGSASITPDPPYVDPAISNWLWDFGDPASGLNNTASGQIANHTFIGSGSSFTVKLVTQGTCGPDSTTTVVNLRPRPTVDAGPAQVICEGTPATLTSTTTNLTNPIIYSWTGPGIFTCNTCQNTDLSGLAAGGPYTATITVVDSFLCTADTTVQITVNPKPVVDAGLDQQVCANSNTPLDATPTAGNGPFGYSWSPITGLDNDAIKSPTAFVTGPSTYCVQISDSIGCMSDPDCVDIDIFSKPSITPATPVLCASDPTLQNTFTVNGAGAGSTYRWFLSPNYSLITGTNVDSSSVTVTFPTSVAATYSFTVIVVDGITGCIDTVSTSFSVTTGLNMTITGPLTLCEGNTISLTAGGATNYTWSASPAYVFADSTLATQLVSPAVSTLFTVTGTTATCTQTINYGVAVNLKPTAVAQPIPPVCGCALVSLNGNGSSPGMTYLWSSASGNTITNPNVLATLGQACVDDIFTLRVTDPGTGCFKDTAVAATVKPKPDANAFILPNLICNGTSTLITLDGSGSNTDPGTIYHWSSNNTAAMIADTTSLSTTATVSTASVFTLIVTDSQGCDSITSGTVQIYPIPAFVASSPFLCTTDPILQSTLEILGASNGSIYNWTSIPACVTPGSSTFDSETFDFSTCGTGSFTFDVTVTDALTSCVNDLSLTVQIVNGVTLTVSSDTAICEGEIATLFASGANSYLWNGIDTNSTISIPGLTVTGSPYTFYISGYIGGCSADDSVSVTVNPIPVTSPISGALTICAGDTGIFYDVTPLIGNYTWTITGGTISSGQNTSVITVNWDSAGLGTLSVVDTNSFGCPGNTENIAVTINALPDSTTSIQGTQTVCEASNEIYFVLPNAGSTYSWAVTGGTINGSNLTDSISVDWGTSGSGTVTVFEINSNACAGPNITVNITINPKPLIPIVLGDQTVCDSSQVPYTTTFNVGSTLNWSINGGSLVSGSTNNDSINVLWNTAGTGSVSVHEINSYGCSSDTNDYTVLVNVKPLASASPDSATICQNNSIAITGNATGTGIQWVSNGSGSFSNATIASPTYFAGNSDTGFVQLQMIVSSLPCPDDTATVVLYISPSPIVNISGTSNTICYGENDTLTVQSSGNYLWTPSGSTNPTIVVSPLVTTTYYVTVTNSNLCSTTDSVLVTVNPPGIPDAGNDQLICRGDSATFFGTQAGGGGYRWSSLGDGTFIPNVLNQQVTYVPGVQDTANGFARIVLATTGYCLNLTDTLFLLVNDLPTINAGTDTTVTSGPGSGVAIPLSPTLQNSTGVFWTTSGTGTFSPSDTAFNTQYIPSDNDFKLDSVIITATATGACTPVSDIIIIEFTPFSVPNVFTPYPASPGSNDYFEIKNLPPNTGLKIWNRWGLVIFSTEDYLNDWEAPGHPAEIYYYVLTTTRKEYKGWVQVFKD